MITARITRGAAAERVRVSPATLILDAKRAIGMGATTNTAYGPQVNDRMRDYARGRGVAPGDLPPPATDPQWRNAPVLPAYLVKLLVWAAYADGLSLAAVTVESAQGVPRWGVAASGARTPAQREATSPDAAPAVSDEVPGGPTVRVEPRPAQTTTPSETRTEQRTDTANPARQGDADACVAVMPGSWHLRDTATAASSGREYPPGTRVVIIGAQPDITRGSAEQFFRVRVESDGREGFAFIPSSALPACAPGAAVRGELGRAVGDATASALATAAKVIAGTAAVVGLAAAGIALRGWLRERRARTIPPASTWRLDTLSPAKQPPPSRGTPQPPPSHGTPQPPPPGLVGPQTVPQIQPRRGARRVAS